MVLAAILGCTAVAAGATILNDQVVRGLRNDLHVAHIRGVVTIWNAALARHANDLRRTLEQEVASGGVPFDFQAQAAWLATARIHLRDRGITGLQIQRVDDPPPDPAAPAPVDARIALLDPVIMAEALRHHHPLSGLMRHGDDLLVAVALPVLPSPQASPTERAMLVAVSGVIDLIDAVRGDTGATVGLADPDGRFLVAPPGPKEWATLVEQTAPDVRAHRSLDIGDRVLGVDDLPLLDLAGKHIGYRRLVMDETNQLWATDLQRLIQLALLLGLLAAVSGALTLWARRAFYGIESAMVALQSLARGDITVHIEGGSRRDEAGAAARALSVFRQGQIAARSNASRALRRRRQRLRYIDAQLGNLSGTFDASDRAAMDAEIRGSIDASEGETPEAGGGDALNTLAVAFRVMVDRVRQQHSSLQRLIADKDAALRTQVRVQALEQEVSLVARMQARMVPEALPDEGLVSVRGRLLQGARFGGDFIDFFWLGDGIGTQRRIALVLGWVDGEGLAAAFLAISARALVRALLATAASPGACLRRVSDLLVGDNEAGLALNMTLVVVEPEANLMIAARAGLPPPIAAVRAGNARILEVEGASPLGLRHGTKVPDTTLDLPDRTVLILFSQGVSAIEIGGVLLGSAGMRDLVARAPDLDADPLAAWLTGQLTGPGVARAGDASLVILRSRA